MANDEETDVSEQDDSPEEEELDFGSIHEIISIYEAHLRREPGRKPRKSTEHRLDQTVK